MGKRVAGHQAVVEAEKGARVRRDRGVVPVLECGVNNFPVHARGLA